MPTKRETIRLAKGIVLAQGNAFIKELLRERGIRLGATKADFETNMVAAIDDGTLTHEQIDLWLRETEGWGNQHIYLYSIPQTESPGLRRLSSDEIRTRLNEMDLDVDDVWEADASLEFPDTPTLTGVYRDDFGNIQFVWHQGSEAWKRDPSRDFDEEIDGDYYRFKANRYIAKRTVVRCEIRPDRRLVGIFIQLQAEQGHRAILQEVKQCVSPLIELTDRRRVSVSRVILGLDGQALAGGGDRSVTSRQMQLRAGGGSVTFASAGAEGSYLQSQAVRRVRRSVQPDQFTGNRGEFIVPVSDEQGGEREIRVELYGEQWRIRVHVQMKRDEVWDLVSFLGSSHL